MNKKIIGIISLVIMLVSGLITVLNINATPVYFGNNYPLNAVHISDQIVIWRVSNLNYLFNDDNSLWTDIGVGVVESADSVNYTNGTLSAKFDLTAVGTLVLGKYQFLQTESILGYDYLDFDFYGLGNSYVYRLYLYTTATDTYRVNFIDSYAGWHHYALQFSIFTITGVPNKSTIVYMALYKSTTTALTDTLRIDNIYAYSIPLLYETWDGITLIYQGLVDPGLSPFLGNVPIFTPTNYIQLYMVWICIFISMAGCILSFPIPFLGFLTIIINLTILHDFLFTAKAITGYIIATNNQVMTLFETYLDLRLFCVILFIANCGCLLIGIINKYME